MYDSLAELARVRPTGRVFLNFTRGVDGPAEASDWGKEGRSSGSIARAFPLEDDAIGAGEFVPLPLA